LARQRRKKRERRNEGR
jgi:hypothetical protein